MEINRSLRSGAATAWLALHGPFVLLITLLWLSWIGAHPDIPLSYAGDSLTHAALFKNLAQGGWIYRISRLGAPFGGEYLDLPGSDLVLLAFAWIIAQWTSSFGLIFNVYYLLGFFAIYASSFAVLRYTGLAAPLAAAGAFVFSLLPFHFWRLWHLFLATYFVIPIIIWLCLRVWTLQAPNAGGWKGLARQHKGAVALAALTAGCGIYYAFFSAMLVTITSLIAAARRKSLQPLLLAAAMIAAICVVAFGSLAPGIAYRFTNGPNPEGAVRSAAETQMLGLNLSLALMPQDDHRIGWVRGIKQRVTAQTPILNENTYAALGVVASAGVIALLLSALGTGLPRARTETFELLAVLNLICILYAVSGGFGFLFSLFVSPEIRALNRISVVIGFLGITASMLLADTLVRRAWKTEATRNRGAWTIAAAFTAIALVDQIPWGFPWDREITIGEFQQDAQLVNSIENSVPAGTKILQLPYMEYPERPPLFAEQPYAMLRPYLHSNALQWSYGAMRGRNPDGWIRALSHLPVPEMVDAAAASGFGGIFVDRNALSDDGAVLLQALMQKVGKPALTTRDGRQVFFRLAALGGGPIELPVLPALGAGFYGWEKSGQDEFTWSSGDSEMYVLNVRPRARSVDVEFDLRVMSSRTVRVTVNGNETRQFTATAGASNPAVMKGITLRSGDNRIRFDSDGPTVIPKKGDTRALSFVVSNLKIRDAASP